MKQQEDEWTTISEFEINRSNPSLSVGFELFAPVVISFPATTSTEFQLTLINPSSQARLAEVKLSGIPRIERYSEKTLEKMHLTPLPTPTQVTNSPASPEATGLEVDKMSRKWIAEHFDRSPSLQNQPEADRQVREMAAELWGEVDGVNVKSRKYGKGEIMNGLTLEEVFGMIQLPPDCKLPEDNSIHYGHRSLGGIDIYFISNQTGEEKIIHPEFRVTGKQPELWEATSGSIRTLPAFEIKAQTTSVPTKLAPYESVFMVFREKAKKRNLTDIQDNYSSLNVIEDLKSPWMVSFDPAFRGPTEPVIFEKLHDWTTSSDESIKYYSGTAHYGIKFSVPAPKENEAIEIDLGNFTAMAKVKVNGSYVGGVWTYPYKLEISDFVKPGENKLEIEVVNNWMNRLIGDQHLPEAQRKTWCFVNPYNAKSPLQPSGLFGPVTIQSVKY